MATATLSKQYAQDFSELVHKYAIAGNPDDCKARLDEYIDAGARLVLLSPCCPDPEVDANLENIATGLVAAYA
jgi:alkanesulfonate monooxygenase SsuD/methylene tetrahydromethanopterin reductase-like flavin-dependent oxidoreductase (luciferase family)